MTFKKIDFKNKNLWLHTIYAILFVLIALAIVFFMIDCSQELFGRLSYNLKEVYTADHALYFGVSKGLLAGLKPYRDMYENKPPMIFLLGAISFGLFKNYYLLNVLCFLSILIICFVPLGFLIKKSINTKPNPLIAVLVGIIALFVSIILGMYGDLRSGEAQVELFGASTSMLCLLLLMFIKPSQKFYSPFIILVGVLFGITAMFKEPHAVLLFFLILLFVRKDTLLNRLVYPIGYALITILIILLCSNCIDSYFTIYLKNMLGSHINNYGSPWERMFDFRAIYNDLKNYSEYLPTLLIILFVSDVVVLSYRTVFGENLEERITHVTHLLILVLSMYVSSFIIGLGGQYYNHHFAFGLPFYSTLLLVFINEFPFEKTALFSEIKDNKIQWKKAVLTFLTIVFAYFSFSYSYNTIANRDEYEPDVANIERTEFMKKFNAYVDDICDCLGEDRYLFIGFNGWHSYGYGNHLPYGPNFAQDGALFNDRNNYFCTTFLENLHKTNFIVSAYNNLGEIRNEVNEYIGEHFTIVKSATEKEPIKPDIDLNGYLFYYRIK